MSKAFTKEDDSDGEEPDKPLPIATGPRYITPQGYKKVADELASLERTDRRRIALSKLLEELIVITPDATQTEQVLFGATVTIVDDDDHEFTYRLVGVDETDLSKHAISIESPMGRALLGKKIGDVVTVARPKGDADFTIEEISFS